MCLRKVLACSAQAFLLLLGFAMSPLPVEASVAPFSSLSITEVCLLDGNGSRAPGMVDCLTEPYPALGGAMSSSTADAYYPGYQHFKASRYRISDYSDAYYMSAAFVSDGDLHEQGGLYNFATGTYFRPSFFGGGGTSRAVAALRINAGVHAVTPIDVWGECRYVDNDSTNDIFVPFRSYKEWSAFYNNPPSGVTLKTCALPCPGHCDYYFGPTDFDSSAGDRATDNGPDAGYFRAELPYARTGAQWPPNGAAAEVYTHTFNYSCYDRNVQSYCGQSHDETVCDKSIPPVCQNVTVCDATYSRCVDTWHNWAEVWRLNPATAGASSFAGYDATGRLLRDNGWTYPDPPSYRVSGGRPAACNNDGEHDYQELSNQCQAPPPTNKPKVPSGGGGAAPPPSGARCKF